MLIDFCPWIADIVPSAITKLTIHAACRLQIVLYIWDIGNQFRKVVTYQLLGSRLNLYRLLNSQLSQCVLTSRCILVS